MPINKQIFTNFSPFRNQAFKSKGLYLWLFLIWCLACVLALVGLGDLPLRDFDEGTVARVSFELSQKSGLDKVLPTIWGNHYLNKPPGIHWLISRAIDFSRENPTILSDLPAEFHIRLIPALLSTLVVPLGGLIQFSLRPNDRLASISTAGILLTLLPIARHGRLAMLDGTQLTAIALLWLILISLNGSNHDRYKLFGAGIVISSLLLMKAPIILPVALGALIPLIKEKRIKTYVNGYSFLIGLIPGISWHVWNASIRGLGATWLWWGDGAGRVLFYPGVGSDLGWRVPLIEILEGGWPWLALLPFAITWAWFERHSRWGVWILSNGIILCSSIFPLRTQLPWYSHPLWLPISLLCGRLLSWLVQKNKKQKMPFMTAISYVPVFWIFLGFLLIIIFLLGQLNVLIFLSPYKNMAVFAGIGWCVGGIFLLNIARLKRLIGLAIVFIGSFGALIILMASPLWLWELNENWSVLPVAELVSHSGVEESIALDESYERPSLNWYAKKRIRTVDENPESNWILTRKPNKYRFLTNSKECKIVNAKNSWSLIFCLP